MASRRKLFSDSNIEMWIMEDDSDKAPLLLNNSCSLTTIEDELTEPTAENINNEADPTNQVIFDNDSDVSDNSLAANQIEDTEAVPRRTYHQPIMDSDVDGDDKSGEDKSDTEADPTYQPIMESDSDGCDSIMPAEQITDIPEASTPLSPSPSQSEVTTDEEENMTTRGRTRKRMRYPEEWERNKRLKARESGKEYLDIKGKQHLPRKCEGVCKKGCKLNCMLLVNNDERLKVFKEFWRLSDEKKLHFYSKFIEQNEPSRRVVGKKGNKVFKKHKTYTYNFEVQGARIRVCREFFLSVLNISKQRIYYFFKTNIDFETGVAKSPTKGKYIKNCIDSVVLEKVRSHINSFPKVDSHYCRASSERQYLDQRLNITKMYELYLESGFIVENKPVKLHKYRSIFNTEFNLSFFTPRKDRCDTCEAFKMLKDATDVEQASQQEHIFKKSRGKEERDRDRAENKRGPTGESANTAVLCFDLENTFALPKAEVSNFFYKRKLNVYNLTAHCSIDGATYCALWHEALSGRAGNHIASAIVRILHALCADHPSLKHLILWSDSCVPQNRNSVMSTAIIKFLAESNSPIEIIEQKYSEAGHGLIQEIDAIHSKIERYLKTTEIFSPVSLLRLLKSIPAKSAPLNIIQMRSTDFFNYQVAASGFNFNQIPYTKVKQLKYETKEPMHVSYRCAFDDGFTKVRLNRTKLSRVKKSPNTTEKTSPNNVHVLLPKVNILSTPVTLSVEKMKDLRSMFRYMPQIDVAFYKAILK